MLAETSDARPHKAAPLRARKEPWLVKHPAEWRQMFDDAWRIERDFFYDPYLHMVPWQQMRERYGDMLKGCVTRADVNYVLGELLGELNTSHAYRSGGDLDGLGLGRHDGLACVLGSVSRAGCVMKLRESSGLRSWEGLFFSMIALFLV